MPVHDLRIVRLCDRVPREATVFAVFSMDGSDLCFEIEKRALAGFVYSESVAR